ncbi:phosphatidylserine decarboxylase family protein [bacterium]|nr:phosphatidylserine decarboxylase family protein [bacterium]
MVIGTVVLGGSIALCAWLLPWLAIAPALLLVFVYSFFRDPERQAPGDADDLLSPADGVVADIGVAPEDEFLKADTLRIGIFMSVFNVHVNRAPLAGRVVWKAYRPGRFHNAMRTEAAAENECGYIAIERADGVRIVVRQVAGLIARRIVTACSLDDPLERGERFGMIKFGSRLEVYIPASVDFRPSVSVGDRMTAGLSILGRIGERAGDGT